MLHPSVLIVGAGPTGLVLALCLARHGIRFRLIDKNAGPGEASRALVVHARTLEFYHQLGIADEAVERGIKVETFRFREGGEEIARLQFADLGEGLSPFPFLLCFPQDDHERFLGEKLLLAGIEVEWGTALEGLSDEGSHVSAVLRRAGTQEECRFDYICGCDGAHSTVRHSLGLEFPGGTYEQLFYVADVVVEGAARGTFTANLGEYDLALLMPVRSSGTDRLVGLVREKLSDREGLTFDDVREDAERLIGARVERVNWFSTYRVHHRVASRFRVGRVFICGDAGHIHSPAGGQGMNTGIGDAVNLSWKLAHVLQGKARPELLDTYEPERIAFARALVNTTDRAFRVAVGEGLTSRLFRTWLIPHVVPFLTGFANARRAMFSAVSQMRINYHESPLSEGVAGHVQGGDRLSWVDTDEYDNFAPLRSLEWQVHIYGVAGEMLRRSAMAAGFQVAEFPYRDAAEAAGFRRDAWYLVRPDGYVALADEEQDPRPLEDFARSWRLVP